MFQINYKSIIIFSLLFILLLSFGTVSASDINTTEDINGDVLTSAIDFNENCLSSFNGEDSTGNDEILEVSNDSLLGDSDNVGSFSELNELILNTTSSTLNLNKDYTFNSETDTVITISKTITINGNGHTLDCDFSGSRLFKVSAKKVILKNMNIINAKSTSAGSAIYWGGANGQLVNVNFTNCEHTKAGSVSGGGAVFWSGSKGTVNNCNFVNCTSHSRAGSIHWKGTNGVLKNSYFDSSSAVRDGSSVMYGAASVYWEGSNGKIENVNITNSKINTVSAAGILCDIHIQNGDCYLDKVTVGKSTGVNYSIAWGDGKTNNVSCNLADYVGEINVEKPVRKAEVSVNPAANIIDSNSLQVSVSNVSSGTLSYNGKTYSSANGTYLLDVSGLKMGSQKLSVTYSGNTYYNSLSTSFNVARLNTDEIKPSNVKSFSTLQSLINSASSGSTISLSYDYLYGSGDKIISITKKSLTIDGRGHILDLNGERGAFLITTSNITFKNITFINGYSKEGGAIQLSASNCTVSYCNFINNTASSIGGAIFSHDAIGLNSLNVDYSCFIGNTAPLIGGSIYLSKGSSRISNSFFISGSSGYAGAVGSVYNRLNLSDSYFINNTASGVGGAVYKKSGEDSEDIFNMSGCVFEGNTAYYDGGAVYISHETLNIADTLFKNNLAGYGGGAIHSLASEIVSDNVVCEGGFMPENNNGIVQTQYINSFIDAENYTMMVSDTSTYNGTLPSYFNLADYGWVSSIKDQVGSICWSYATMGALESSILKATGIEYDFSEDNLLNNVGGYSDYGIIGRDPHTGGFSSYGTSYLANWFVPIDEDIDPMKNIDYFSPILNSDIHVQNMVFLPNLDTNADLYKEALMKYGAIKVSILVDTYSGANFYTNSSGNNHAVIIVGWDDDYTAKNFPDKGAWICKNSWGDSWGDDGYFYISYYDNSIGRQTVRSAQVSFAIFFNDTVSYHRNYHHDVGNFIWANEKTKNIWYKNIYTSVGDEKICAFSSVFSEKCDWEVSIYVNDELKHTQSGYLNMTGYFTFNLDKFIPVCKGDQITIVLKTSNGASRQYFPVVTKTNIVTNTGGKNISFYSKDGKTWEDLDDSNLVASLKLFTQKSDTLIDINCENTSYGDDLNIIVNVNATGNISLSIADKTYSAILINNTTSISVPDLNIGKYTITVSYSGDNNHNANTTTYTVNIEKQTINIDAAYENISYGEDLVVDITLSEAIGGTATVNIDGKNYTVSLVKGAGKVTVSGLNAGTYDLTVNYAGDNTYTVSSKKYTVTVDKIDTVVSLSVKDITYGSKLTVNVALSEEVNDTVVVTCNNKQYTVNLVNGAGKVTISSLGANTYTITADYAGNTNYNGDSDTCTATVNKKATTVTVSTTDVVYGSDLTVNVKLSASITAVATVNVNNKNYTVSLTKGAGSVNISGLNAGTYTVSVSYAGNSNYVESSNSCQVTVDKKATTLTVSAANIVYGSDLTINISLSEAIDVNAVVNVNNKNYTVGLTKGAGKTTISGLNGGTYTVTVNYAGSTNYAGSSNSCSLTVDKKATTLTVSAANIAYGSKLTVNVALSEAVNDTVVVICNNEQYTVNLVNGAGKVSISSLGANTYTITADYIGTSNYAESSNTCTATVSKKSTSITVSAANINYGSSLTVDVKLSESVTAVAVVNVNNKDYTVSLTKGAGSVSVSGLNAGTYTVTVNYAGSANYAESSNSCTATVSKKSTSVTVSAANINYGGSLTVDVALSEAIDVNAVVNVNNKDYTVALTKGAGKVIISGLNAGTYTVTVNYAGNTNYAESSNSCTVTVNRKATSVTVSAANINYGSSLTINVALSEAIDVNVVVNVNNKNYTVALTKGAGKATISGLNAGTYTVTVNYAGNANYVLSSDSCTVTINRKATALTVSAGNIVYGSDLTVNISLSEAIDVNVVVNVNNKNYTVALTKGAGKATISGLNAGTYDVTASFAGNANYVLSSDSCTVVVTKKDAGISVSADNIVYGSDLTVNVGLSEAINGEAVVNVNNKNYSVSLTKGVGKATISGLDAGTYTVTATYSGGSNYGVLSDNCIVTVARKNTQIAVSANNVVYGSDLTVDVALSEAINGEAVVNVNNKDYGVSLTKGAGKVIISGLNAGTYTVTVNYAGNANYVESSSSCTVTVSKKATALTVSAANINYGDSLTVDVRLSEAIDADAVVNVNSKDYAVRLTKGVGKATISGLNAGTYTVTAGFAGNSNYEKSSGSCAVTVNSKNIGITLSANNIVYGSDLTVDISLSESVNGNVVVSCNNKQYNVNLVNGAGKTVISGLNAGTYTVTASYAGDNAYSEASGSCIVAVNKKSTQIAISSANIAHDGSLVVNIVSDECVNGAAIVTVGAKSYTVNLVNGAAKLTVSDLTSGTSNLAVSYLGDNNYYASSNTYAVTFNKKNTGVSMSTGNIIFGGSSVVSVKLSEAESGAVVFEGEHQTVNVVNSIANTSISTISANLNKLTASYFTGTSKVQISIRK